MLLRQNSRTIAEKPEVLQALIPELLSLFPLFDFKVS